MVVSERFRERRALDVNQQLEALAALGALAACLLLQSRVGRHVFRSPVHWSHYLRECGRAILCGGFVAFGALWVSEWLPRPVASEPGPGWPTAFADPIAFGCIGGTLLLLCCERARWVGHQPATILAALVVWLLLADASRSDAAGLPVAPLGLGSAVLYRVALGGARRARQLTRARQSALDATGDGVLVVNTDGRLVDANEVGREAFRELAGRDRERAKPAGRKGRRAGNLGALRLPERVCALLMRPEAKHFSLRNVSDDVYEVWLGRADQTRARSGYRALIVRDVSDQRRDEKRLLRLAHYDSLTGLANRRLFVEQLERALDDVQNRAAGVALLYIDLDRFKEINDTLGHGAGDELLRVLAGRFQEHLAAAYPPRLRGPRSASVARLGGDEFAVIVPEPESLKAIEELARRLLSAIAEPVSLNQRDIAGSGSIGIALYPTDGRDVETLVKHADSALYGAKRLGRNRFERYQPEFSREADRNRAIEQELRGAIERGELELHYQPKIDVSTNTVGGFEALLRWNSRELGPVGPEEFIPIAEERGLIARIGAWCLDEACRQQRAWLDDGLEAVTVAVNVSSAQFIGSNLQDLVSRAIERNDLDPKLIEIELTERLLLEDSEQTSKCLADLQAVGVAIALDDFGTGYSALTYLNRFPLNVVKMDRGLLQNIETSDSAAGISAAVIAMCHSLGLEVVAEGVDSEGQLDMLREMDCDLIQGFLFSPALRAADVTRMLGGRGMPRPVLEPKPSIPPAVVPVAEHGSLDVEVSEWAEEGIESAPAGTARPRALLVDATGSLDPVVARLRHLGVDVVDVTQAAASGRFVPGDAAESHFVLAAVEGNMELAARVVDIAGCPADAARPGLLVVGEEPDAVRRRAIREAGATTVLWAPFDDSELRFVVRSFLPSSLENPPNDPSQTRNDARIPMDAMAWIRFRSRRDVGVLSSLSRRGAFIEMADPLQEGTSCKLEFDLPSGRISTFAKVIYRESDEGGESGILASGIGVAFYGLDPASDFTIGELIEASADRFRP